MCDGLFEEFLAERVSLTPAASERLFNRLLELNVSYIRINMVLQKVPQQSKKVYH